MNIERIGMGTPITVSNQNFNGIFRKKEIDTTEFSTKEKQSKFKKPTFSEKTKNRIKIALAAIVSGLAVFGISLGKTKQIRKEIIDLKEQINNIVLPEDFDERVGDKITQINNSTLKYDPTKAITSKEKEEKTSYGNKTTLVLPKKYEGTTLRSDAKELTYPKFEEGKPYYFEFPQSPDIKISHENCKIKPIPKTITTVSESYSDSLAWDNNKIARDLLQNFYDGHGQTLDGVKFDIQPNENGTYKVKIAGESTYSADKAIMLGESSKKNNDKAAGNYGEGLKMVVLKLLKEKGTENVNIVSNNWKVNWTLEETGFDKKALAYQLDEIEPINGNYIEFDTNDTDFIKSIINSFDRFYHHNNPAFKCPDFENDILSIKYTDINEKGRFYIAGQAFEIDGDYENLAGMSINIKKKPPMKYQGDFIFDPSRDRTSLTSDNINALGQWIVSKENMSKEDTAKLIHSFEDYWDMGDFSKIFEHSTKGTSFFSGILRGATRRYDLNIKFPNEKDIADSWKASSSLKEDYKKAGYRLCDSYLGTLGMKKLEDLIAESRQHKALEPTDSEKNKILILKEAIQLFAPILKEYKLFSDKELDTKIFIFDRTSKEEDESYKDTKAEAIIEEETSLGFWVDRTTLKESSFSEMLGTGLHELTHKYGGDESCTFSYKLTDVMQIIFQTINKDPNLALKLKVLEKAWNEQKEQ